MTSRLTIAACRRLCRWQRTEELLDGRPLFACSGCGSQWVRSEPWTPVDHTGQVPEAVQAERQRFRPSAGAGAADTAGRSRTSGS